MLEKKCYILRVVTIKVIYTSEGLSNLLFKKCDVVNHHVCTSITIIKFSCLLEKNITPAGIYSLKMNNENTRTICEICSKLTLKIPTLHQWRHSSVFNVNFAQISNMVPVFPLWIWTSKYCLGCVLSYTSNKTRLN